MAYHKIGVFGATGHLGSELIRALVDEGFEVVPFSRQNTIVAGIPTQPLGSLVGFDVIISAVGHHGMYEQIPLIDRAKKDGAKRFIPSEFGVDHRTVKAPFFEAKIEIAKYVQEANFPDGWTAVASGFLEWTIPLFVRVDSQKSLITVSGNGKTQYPFIIRYDIGRILAETFRNPSKYKDAWILAANSWLSLDEIAQHVQRESQMELKIQHEDLTEQTPVLQLLEQGGLQPFERSQQSDFATQQADIEEVISGYFKQHMKSTAN